MYLIGWIPHDAEWLLGPRESARQDASRGQRKTEGKLKFVADAKAYLSAMRLLHIVFFIRPTRHAICNSFASYFKTGPVLLMLSVPFTKM
jgi:hypothetical protein